VLVFVENPLVAVGKFGLALQRGRKQNSNDRAIVFFSRAQVHIILQGKNGTH
jgi:hypothetical protein